jgi:hypothetical protein
VNPKPDITAELVPGTAPDTGQTTTVDTSATPDVRIESKSSSDRFMRKLLRLPEGKTSTAAEARSAFQKSLAVTACRCIIMYIVLPFVLPVVGVASGVSPAIGLVIGFLAIVSIIYSIRRFWRANHSKRWHYTIFASVIIGFLLYLSVKDIIDLTN